LFQKLASPTASFTSYFFNTPIYKMAQKPAIPKGTRDFLPTEVAKRNYMFAIIRRSIQALRLCANRNTEF